MLLPCVGIEHEWGGRRHASALRWHGSVKRAADAEFVVVVPECLQLLGQVDRVPEEYAIEILAADSDLKGNESTKFLAGLLRNSVVRCAALLCTVSSERRAISC